MMSFWNVLISLLSALYFSLMYGAGFETGYSAVMHGHNFVGVK